MGLARGENGGVYVADSALGEVFLIGPGAEPAISTTAEFTEMIKSELVKWARVVKESGAKLD